MSVFWKSDLEGSPLLDRLEIVADIPHPAIQGEVILCCGDIIDLANGLIHIPIRQNGITCGYFEGEPLQDVIDQLILHDCPVGYTLRSCYRLAKIERVLSETLHDTAVFVRSLL